MTFEVLKIKERIQAGDVFLFKFDCPYCNEENLMPYPISKTDCCHIDLSKKEINIKHSRLLCGTKRPGKISKKIIQMLLAVQGPYCGYCSINFEKTPYHVEHIVPLSAGGTNNFNNLCLSCPTCNLIASSKVFCSFEGKRSYILEKRI